VSGLKDETAVHKKTDAPSAASMDGIDKDGDVSQGITTTLPSSSSATDTGTSRRHGRGKSSLNADVVSPFMFT